MQDHARCLVVELESSTGYKIWELVHDYDNEHGTFISYDDFFKRFRAEIKSIYNFEEGREIGYQVWFQNESDKVEFVLQWL